MGPHDGHYSERTLYRFRQVPSYAWLGLVILMITAWAIALPQLSLAAPGSWSYTQPMSENRECHTATLLPNGKVLVMGGFTSNDFQFALGSAELYDPGTGTWRPTAPAAQGRGCHTATLMPDGKVLITGGGNNALPYLVTEIYDSVAESWSQAPGAYSFAYNSATLLMSGKVLQVGGELTLTDDILPEESRIYDPISDQWTDSISTKALRAQHTATLLPSGKVLVTGGITIDKFIGSVVATDSAEIFDPVSGFWRFTSPLNTERYSHTTTLLRNGKVLLHGGTNNAPFSLLFDPDNETWRPTGSLGDSPYYHTATLLVDGKVLIAGGLTYLPDEIYEPSTETWTETGSMGTRRSRHTATLLPNGKVLVTGGRSSDSSVTDALNSAELYEPDSPANVSLPALLAFYPFDVNVNDASGNGRDGTVAYPPLELVSGYEAQAFTFNTSSSNIPDYIFVPLDINPSKYPKLTMGAWAKTKTSGALQPLITHDNGGLDRQVGIDTRGNGSGWSAFCGPTGRILGAVPAIHDKWTFVAVVYNQAAQTVRLQVDDMVLTKAGVTLGPGETKLYIGGNPNFYDFFDGIIDNVFIFGDALTDGQLAYIRNGGAKAILTATSNNCAAILDDMLSLHIPAIVFNGQYYWADFGYVQSTVGFVLTNAGFISDTSPFKSCTASTLSQTLQLHVPEVLYAGESYWANLQYAHGAAFALTGAGLNLFVTLP